MAEASLHGGSSAALYGTYLRRVPTGCNRFGADLITSFSSYQFRTDSETPQFFSLSAADGSDLRISRTIRHNKPIRVMGIHPPAINAHLMTVGEFALWIISVGYIVSRTQTPLTRLHALQSPQDAPAS